MELRYFRIIPQLLHFKQPAGTSRAVLRQRQVYFLVKREENKEGVTEGWGEAAPLDGLSPEGPDFHERMMELSGWQVKSGDIAKLAESSPSLRFAAEAAERDFRNGGKRIWFPDYQDGSTLKIPINGLIWMGSKAEMFQRIKEKLSEGYSCLKLKIGGIRFDEEVDLLKFIRRQFDPSDLELRLDANGSFSSENATERLKVLSEFYIHSVEQPIRAGQPEEMASLCERQIIPIALDEELIGLKNREEKRKLLKEILPQYTIFKPSLIGGIEETKEYIDLCRENGIDWWITSALESNVGLNILAQFCHYLRTDRHQGLGTGKLFTNNIRSPLEESKGTVFIHPFRHWPETLNLREE